MFCQQCGKEIPDDSRFCTSCGAPTPIRINTELEPVNTYFSEEGMKAAPVTPPVYRAEPYQPAAAPARKRKTTRWPASTGVMGVLHVVFYLAAMVPLYFYYDSDIYMSVGSFIIPRILYLILAIAVPVLFFIHTKKIAFITAIPMFINLILLIVNSVQDMRFMDSFARTENLLIAAFEFILVVLYIIQMIVRAHNPAMPIIYLVFSILELLVALIFLLAGFVEYYRPELITEYSVLNFVSSVFLTIAYCIAMFSSRKR